MTAGVQNMEKLVVKWGKKGPSKTTLKHSLNLCNGYAAGNWANLPCKKSPFYTQHFKGEKERGFREPVGTWEGGGSGRGLELHICLLEWQKLAEGVQNERFSWSRAE